MACVSSPNAIGAASSTTLPAQPTSRPLTAAAASSQEIVHSIILPGVPTSDDSGIIRVPSPIPASSRSTTTATLAFSIRTTSKTDFVNIGELRDPNEEVYKIIPDGNSHGDVKIKFDNGDTYVGPVANGMLNGYGTFTNYSTRQVYQGQFLNNMLNGSGKIILDGRVCYDGQFLNDEFDGHGMLKLPNGETYNGSFKKGIFNGQGTITHKGNVFEGIFKDGQLCQKQVKITFPTGVTYEGPIKNYKAHGSGKQTDRSGISYEGPFIDGKRHGIGKLYHPDGTSIPDVEYRDDKFVTSSCCIIL